MHVSKGTESVTSDQKQSWMTVRLLAVARLPCRVNRSGVVPDYRCAAWHSVIRRRPARWTAAPASPDMCRAPAPLGCLRPRRSRNPHLRPRSTTILHQHQNFRLAVVAGAGAGEHCHAAAAGTPTSTNTVFAGPEATPTTTELESGPLTVEATAAPTAESEFTSVHSVSQPCTENCSACSTSITRRPREQSALSFAARPHIPSVRRLITNQ